MIAISHVRHERAKQAIHNCRGRFQRLFRGAVVSSLKGLWAAPYSPYSVISFCFMQLTSSAFVYILSLHNKDNNSNYSSRDIHMLHFIRSIISFSILSLFMISSNVHAVDGAPVISRILKSGKLVVGTTGDMPLMSEKLVSGELVGFDIDMAKAMAETMGVKLELRTMPFDHLIPALEQGMVDIVLSNMTMTINRNMRIAFAGPYFVSGKCLVTREQEIAQADEPEDLKAANAKIAVIKGTTSEDFVKELLPLAKRMPVDNIDTGINIVASGKANAFLTDFPICLSIMKRYPDSGFQSVVSLLTYEPIGIALPANDPLLINLAENFINRAENVGLIQNLGLKWFGQAKLTTVKQ